MHLQTLIGVRWRMFEGFQVLRGWVEAVRGVTGEDVCTLRTPFLNGSALTPTTWTGIRGGRYAAVNNASVLKNLAYIPYIPGLQASESDKQEHD